MRTKFILHGGFTFGTKQANDAFSKEILSGTATEVKILLVYFAAGTDRIAKYKEDDIEQFTKNSGGRVLTFEVANEDLFPEQVQRADIIYLHGGFTHKMLAAMKKFSNLRQLVDGKVVAADSAGANALAVVSYSKTLGAAEGVGLLPIKIICHYTEENKERLNQIRPELDTILLPEYQLKVLFSE